MRKKTILFIAAAVLVLCVAGVIILFQLTASSPSAENTDPVEVLRAELKELLLEADSMFCSGEVVTVSRNKYTEQYVVYWQPGYKKYYPDAFVITDKAYIIDTAKLDFSVEIPSYVRCDLRYLIFLGKVVERYSEEALIPMGKYGPLNMKDQIAGYPFFYLYTEYESAGYETASDFYYGECHYGWESDNYPLFYFDYGSECFYHYADRNNMYNYPLPGASP